jgi:hypothetical protein
MVQFFAPQNESEVKRRRMMADQLRATSQMPQQTQMVSGVAVPMSPWQGLASALGQGVAGYQEGKINEIEKRDVEQRQQFLKDALSQAGNDPAMLAQKFLENPSTTDTGLQLYMQNLKSQQDAAQWEKDAALKLRVAGMRNQGSQPYVDPVTGELVTPERKLSSTEQKELFDTMDLTSSGAGAIGALTKAKDILTNSPAGAEPYTGFAAETRADAARIPLIGGIIADKERGAATTEYKTLVTEQALNNLKAIFGGMPTEGERQILMQMQALPSYTPQEQERVINNAIEAANRRQSFNQMKMQGIQTGDYKTQGMPKMEQPASGGWTIEEVQ